MYTIFKGIFGSRLYSTCNESSDYDYKGIFIPDIKDCILGGYSRNINIKTNLEKNVKNSAEDSDTELYALQEFIKLALQGQTVSIDMLSTPKDKTLITSPEWEILVKNRKRFYTKRMNSFIGYSLSMKNKYGQRAEKLNSFRDIKDFLSKEDKNILLKEIWDKLPENQFYKKITDEIGRRFYEINGRKMQEFATVGFIIQLIDIQITDYGKRVKEAEKTGMVDYKSLHHAFRVAFQLKQILKEGDLVFPIPEVEFLKQIKYKQLDYFNDNLNEKLENLLDEIEELCSNSSLPEKPDRKWADDFIISCYGNQIK